MSGRCVRRVNDTLNYLNVIAASIVAVIAECDRFERSRAPRIRRNEERLKCTLDSAVLSLEFAIGSTGDRRGSQNKYLRVEQTQIQFFRPRRRVLFALVVLGRTQTHSLGAI